MLCSETTPLSSPVCQRKTGGVSAETCFSLDSFSSNSASGFSHWASSSEINHDLYDNIIECTSPAGSLTNSLLEACMASVSSWLETGESSLIIVTGEEDLAPLLLHPLAPIGSAVVYGQPGKGVVVRWCDEESKDRCRNLLLDFEAN